MGTVILIAISGERQLKSENFSTLEIADSDSGKIYGRRFIENNKEFAIEYTHSVNNSTVHEIFRIDGKKIYSCAVRFYSFGAGMQTELEEGQQIVRDGDALIITGLNKSYTELNYIVGTVSDHLLLVNGERLSLRNLCGRNAHVTLRVR